MYESIISDSSKNFPCILENQNLKLIETFQFDKNGNSVFLYVKSEVFEKFHDLEENEKINIMNRVFKLFEIKEIESNMHSCYSVVKYFEMILKSYFYD